MYQIRSFIYFLEVKKNCKNTLKECEDCRLEHEKMLKVSELIQEAKPYFKRKTQNRAKN